VAEWLKAHAWKVCIRETVSRVRIPLSPPAADDKFSDPYDHATIPLLMQRFYSRKAYLDPCPARLLFKAFEDIATKLLKSSIADASKFTFEFTVGANARRITSRYRTNRAESTNFR
jgi:hypothetical protein